MIIRISILLFSFLTLIGCRETEFSSQYPNNSTATDLEDVSWGDETIVIQIDTLFKCALPSGVSSLFPSSFIQRRSEWIHFSTQDSVLRIFELSQNELSITSQVKLMIPPDYYIDPQAVTYNFDNKEIYLFNQLSMFTFDSSGRHISYLDFEEISVDFIPSVMEQHIEPTLLKNGNFLIHAHSNTTGGYFSKEYYSKPFDVELDAHKGVVVSVVPLSYPSFYQTNFCGIFAPPDRQVDDSIVYYTFPYSDTLFIYDLKNDLIEKRFFGWIDRDKFSVFDEFREDYDDQQLSDSLLFSSRYSFLSFLENEQLLIRTYTPKLRIDNAQGFPTFRDKKFTAFAYDLLEDKVHKVKGYTPGVLYSTDIGMLSFRLDREKREMSVLRLKVSKEK